MHVTADTVASLGKACSARSCTDPQRRPFRSAQRSGCGTASRDSPRRFVLVQSSVPEVSAPRPGRRQAGDSTAESDGRAADDGCGAAPSGTSRRTALVGAVAAAAAGVWLPSPAQAVQGLTAGRVPGASSGLLCRAIWAIYYVIRLEVDNALLPVRLRSGTSLDCAARSHEHCTVRHSAVLARRLPLRRRSATRSIP